MISSLVHIRIPQQELYFRKGCHVCMLAEEDADAILSLVQFSCYRLNVIHLVLGQTRACGLETN